MTLVDSSVWIDFFNGIHSDSTVKLRTLLWDGEAAVGDLMLAEVLQGFASEKEAGIAAELFEGLPVIPVCTADLAIRSAANYRLLRRNGITVRKTIDIIIATAAMEHSLPLLHNDRDFDLIASKLPLRVA